MSNLAEYVAEAFIKMGGDPTRAVENARNYSSVQTWSNSQAAQAATAGAAAMAIPGVHVVTAVADLMFLFHKMAYCCWGIGELRDCVVLGKPDFLNILALWSDAVSPAELKDHVVSVRGLESALLKNSAVVGGVAMTTIVTSLSQQQLVILASKVSEKAAIVLCEQIGSIAGQVAMQVVATGAGIALNKVGVKVPTKVIAKVSGKIGGKIGEKAMTKTGVKMGSKVAAKVAAKLSTKTAAKWFAGMIPVIGAAAGAGINTYFVKSIANSADRYYSLK